MPDKISKKKNYLLYLMSSCLWNNLKVSRIKIQVFGVHLSVRVLICYAKDVRFNYKDSSNETQIIQICRKNLRTQIDCCNDLTQPSASLGRERNQNKEPGITFIEDNRVGWCVSLDE